MMRFSFGKILPSLMVAVLSGSLVMTTTGCSPAQKQTTLQVVTAIHARLPEIIAAADTVAATIEVLDPPAAACIAVGSTTFDVLATTLQSLTAAYIANPNASTLAQIQTAINTMVSNINTATLNAVGIKDVQSQRLAIAALKGLLTTVTIVFGMIAPTETVAQLEQLRGTGTVHLAKLRPYMDEQQLEAAAGSRAAVDGEFATATAFGF